jgi:hypothetical protein
MTRNLIQHKGKIATFKCFTSGYIYTLDQARKAESEIIRIGMAGSLVVLIVETAFYLLDTINSKSKVQ